MNLIFKRKLPIPQEIKEMYPISEEGRLAKEKMMKKLKQYLKVKVINSF